jgi:hypothetical protein
MPYAVVSILQDGTAYLYFTTPDDLANSQEYQRSHGGEVVSTATINAIFKNALPREDGGIPTSEFKRRLARMIYNLGTKKDDVQSKWDRVLALLDSFTTIYPHKPPVSDLITLAVADGLITQAEAVVISTP